MAAIGCPSCGKTIADNVATCPYCAADVVAARAAALRALRMTDHDRLEGLSEAQKTLFWAEMGAKRKERSTALLLCLLLGGIGAHHFYLGNTWAGVVYLLFFWTWIPLIVSLIELFVIGGRVDAYNRRVADLIVARIRAGVAPSM